MPVAFRAIPPMVNKVAPALSAAADTGVPSGTDVSKPKMIGMMVTGTSVMTVPATAGVRTLRNSESRAESANQRL